MNVDNAARQLLCVAPATRGARTGRQLLDQLEGVPTELGEVALKLLRGHGLCGLGCPKDPLIGDVWALPAGVWVREKVLHG